MALAGVAVRGDHRAGPPIGPSSAAGSSSLSNARDRRRRGWAARPSHAGRDAGIGAFGTAYLVVERGRSVGPSLLVAAIAGMLIGGLVGIPALRLSGPQFAVAWLAFGGRAASRWLFKQKQFPRVDAARRSLRLRSLSDTRVYFMMAGVALVVFVLAWGVRRSTHGTLVSRPVTRRTPCLTSACRQREYAWVSSCCRRSCHPGGRPLRSARQQGSLRATSRCCSRSPWSCTPSSAGCARSGPSHRSRHVRSPATGHPRTVGFTGDAIPDIIDGLIVVGLIASAPRGSRPSYRPD